MAVTRSASRPLCSVRSVEIFLVAAVAILVGSTLQRLCGTGVGLVVSPVLAMLLGPAVGVFVTNATTVVSGILIMLAVRRDIDWRRFAMIGPVAVFGAIPAALLVRELPAAWLQIVVGTVVLVALGTTFGLPRMPVVRHRWLAVATGVVGGFFNTTAGVSAPVMVIYSKLSQWEQHRFAATLQPVFALMGLLSVGSKLAVGATTVAELPPWWVFGAIVVVVLGGITVGGRLARRVSSGHARMLAITLAGLGGAVAVVRGIVALAAG